MSHYYQRRHVPNNSSNSSNTSSIWYCRLLSLALIVIYACLLLGLQIAQHRQINQLVAFSTIVEQQFLSISSSRTGINKVNNNNNSKKVHNHHNNANQTTSNNNNNNNDEWWWFQDYVQWHQQQRARLNSSNWNTFRYLVLQCTELDKSCGSILDLKSVPLFVLVGHLSQRILLIHWDYYENDDENDRRRRRRRLTNVLLPPVGGLDWRMPDYLIPEIGFAPRPMTSNKHLKQAVEERLRLSGSGGGISVSSKLSWNVVYAFSSTPGAGGSRLFERLLVHVVDSNHSSSTLTTTTTKSSYDHFVRRAFFTLFTPTRHIATRVQQAMLMQDDHYNQNNNKNTALLSSSRRIQKQQNAPSLIPRQFVGVYIGETATTAQSAATLVDHAMQCASYYYSHSTESPNNIRSKNNNKNNTMYLAAADPQVMQAAAMAAAARETTRDSHSLQVAYNHHHNNNMTAESDNKNSFEDTLVDLLVLSQSQCVLHDQRDLGLFAAWLSYNVSCALRQSFRQIDRDDYAACRTGHGIKVPLSSSSSSQRHDDQTHDSVLFQEPMPHEDHPSDENTNTTTTTTASLKQSFKPFTTAWYLYSDVGDDDSIAPVSYAPPLDPLRIVGNDDKDMSMPVLSDMSHPSTTNFLWESSSSTNLPQWMKDYFSWHQKERAKINPTNWQQFKYIVMQCTKKDKRCGGTADRLKAVPMLILVASLRQRIFLIHWEVPKALEEFLVPPVGGIDWRVPPFLKTRLFPPMRALIDNDHRLKNAMETDNAAIYWNVKYQTYHSGMLFFNEHKPPDSPTFDQVYHDTWRVLFTPVPPIARIVEDFMERSGLIPGEYAAAHIRAQYARVERPRLRTILLTRNALRCASMLFPGGPIFVASDDLNATEEALTYGVKRKSRIVARNDTNTPLHLEKASNPDMRQSSEYYDTFVDFYIMGMGRCVTFNKGGFGHWASLISYNSSCVFRHQFNERYTNCSWTIPSHDVTQRMTRKLQRPIFPVPMP